MVEAGIRRVQDELALWRAAGQKPTFWIRDDDATCVTGQLERLQSIATRYDVSVGLALIPGLLGFRPGRLYCGRNRATSIPCATDGSTSTTAMPATPMNSATRARTARHVRTQRWPCRRFGAFRRHRDGVRAALQPHHAGHDRGAGRHRLCRLSVGPRPLERRIARVVNRFDWAPSLNIAWKGPLPRIDAHVDLIDWQSGSAQAMDVVAQAMVGQLRLRRKGFPPAGAPIGLLTHHRVHDESIWRLLESLIDLIKGSLACKFIQVGRMFQQSRRERTLDPLPSA